MKRNIREKTCMSLPTFGAVCLFLLALTPPVWAGGADNDCCWAPTKAPAECFLDLAQTQPTGCGTQCFAQGGLILPIVCSPNASGICTQCDCNDNSTNVSPASPENCVNGIDDDCDGLVDASDPACGGGPACGNDLTEALEECDGTDDVACPGQCQPSCTCPLGGSCSDFTSSTATVAIHVSETTGAQWGSLGGPHAAWDPWHVYGFLMEQLRSDGTPFDVVSDADIDAGSLMDGGSPRYAILFSLANDCVSDVTAGEIEAFVAAGGHAFIGSTTMTRDETCALRSTGGGGGAIYTPAQVSATAQNFFSASFSPDKTINTNCANNDVWLNNIADLLPTWIQYEFPAAHTISKVALTHSTYGAVAPPFTYLIRNYEVQVSSSASCGSGVGFVTVATNTGSNVIGEIQETTFAPASAKCVRINALYPSYETNPYLSYDTANWIGLNAFQAVEDGTGNLLIDHPCAVAGALPNEFALSAEMGLTAGSPIQIGDMKRTGVVDPLVSHLENDAVVRGWKLANSAGASSFNHPTHWAQEVAASSATVLAATGTNKPILTVRDHGAGRFIYHSEFNPLAGYSMHTIANMVYGFYRKAVDEAHAAVGLPSVRLGTWPWPNVAGFMTRHDHFSNHGFDGIAGNGNDIQVAQIEAAHGVQGGHFLRTDPALPNSGQPCTDGSFGNTCNTAVQNNLLAMVALGAQIGTHTTNESQEPSQANIAASLDRLKAYLGFQPTIFVAPGGSGVRDTTSQGLVNEGIVTKGDVAHGAHPHFMLRIDGATEYSDAARWPLVDMPATGYYGTPGGGAFAGGIWAHEITSNPANCNNDGTVRPCMEKVVDLHYGLGGLINLYDHIGDGALANPTPTQFENYIVYAQSLPDVYTTSPLDLRDWWLRRDPVRIGMSYDAGPLQSVTVELSCANDSGPFSVEVDLPWVGGAVVTVDGNPSLSFELDGNRIRVNAPAPSQVVIMEECQINADCNDGNVCNGVETCHVPSGACLPGIPPNCQPANPPCEGGATCNPQTGCVPQPDAPLSTPCNADGNLCTNDHCNGSGTCVLQSNVSCPGQVPPCEAGAVCNPQTGACDPLPDATLGTPCNADGNVCTDDECNGLGACTHPNNTASCDDGLFCTAMDVCSSASCVGTGDPCAGGTECNDACNEATNDCAEPSGTACSGDGNVCTDDECDGAGVCDHVFDVTNDPSCVDTTTTTTLPTVVTGCEPTPMMTGCFASARAQLQLKKDADDPARSQLSWKWQRGDALVQADLGDPTTTTTYFLCIYDRTASVAELVADVVIDPNAAWTSKDPKGLSYKDTIGAEDGVQKAKVKTGDATKTQVQMKAKGMNLTLPMPFGGGTYFDADPSVVVQLVNSGGKCWTTEFTLATTNTDTQYKAKVQ